MSGQTTVESAASGTLNEGERKVLELIATGAPLEAILDTLCRVIDEQSGLRSSIFLLNRTNERLSFAAGPHLSASWRQAVASFPVTVTACGAAITRQEQTISPSIATDPLFAGFHDAAQQADIRAAWSTPFFSKHARPLGTFAVYSDVEGTPSPRHLALVNRATHLASIAVEHHLTEQGLRDTEERLRQITDNIREAFWMSTADWSQMLYVSPGYETIWGRTCESLYQDPRSWMAAIHPDDRAHAIEVIETERQRGFEIEYRVLRPDGSIRWIRDRGFPINDDAGRVYRVAGIAEDITERKHVDEQLRKSERFLAKAQRLSHIGSWECDLTNLAVTWSDELYRMFGVEPQGIEPARDAIAFIHPADQDAVMGAIERTLKTKETYDVCFRIHRRDGNERTLRSLGYFESDEQGEPAAIFGCTQDITEQKHAEDALRRSEQLLRLVLEAIPVGVIVVDSRGHVILNNPASHRIWAGVIQSGQERYANSRAWRHDSTKTIAPDEWASWRALARGETTINEVIDIEAFDGVRKVIHNSAVPIRDGHQAIIGAVVVNEDISAQKAAERELDASVKQMQMLATRLMHAQDAERRRIAQMLHETTAQDLAGLKMLLARLNRTSDGLLDADRALLAEGATLANRAMSEVRTLAYLLHPPFLDETGLLSALRWYGRGFAERSGIHVDLDAPDTLDRLSRDVETTLFRVVQEGLTNIHRHANSPTAWIRVRLTSDRLTLEIEDQGRGMEPDLVARFKRHGALGLGLAGMRERLKPIGGHLDIESSHRGTVLRASVPLHANQS